MITPSHRFNPVAKNGTGEWQKYTLSMEVGDCRELFLRSKKSWSYLGIFECTDKGKIPVKNHQGPKATVRVFTCIHIRYLSSLLSINFLYTSL